MKMSSMQGILIDRPDKLSKTPADDLSQEFGTDNNQALLEAARNYDFHKLRTLLGSGGCNPKFKDENGKNALHILLNDGM